MRPIHPLNYLPYSKNEAVDSLVSDVGWRVYERKHGESLFTKFFQNYYLPTKFGYDKRRPHLSSRIAAGEIDRAEAKDELEKPLYNETELLRDKDYLCRKLEIDIGAFDVLMSAPTHDHTEFRNRQVSYERLKAAQRVARAANLPVSALTSARDVDDALVVERVAATGLADGAARHAFGALDMLGDGAEGGRVAVIAPGDRLPALRDALHDAGLDENLGSGVTALDAPLILLTPREAKGLEFDVVVLVEPAEVGAASAGDLYVAMTRPTKQLRVVHHAGLPAGFDAEPLEA